MKFDIRETASERVILCAHRGLWGGNIPCNNIIAYEFALTEGADMIEIDVVNRTMHLDVPQGILVQNQNMATSLAVLSVHLKAQIKDQNS